MGALDGRVAIVTGAGRGLGREYALLFAREGAAGIVVNDVVAEGERSLSAAEQTVRLVGQAGGRAVAVLGDCSEWDTGERLLAAALEHFGRLDVLVNNAGILRDRMIFNMTEDEWDAVVRVNLRGHFCPTRHACAHWRSEAKLGRRPDARIITTTSPSGLWGNAGQANYAASKAGIVGFTLSVAFAMHRHGVTANVVAPGADTNPQIVIDGASPELRRALRGEQVAPLVAYLASARSAHINGQVFAAAGGRVDRIQGFQLVEGAFKPAAAWTVDELAEVFDEQVAGENPAPMQAFLSSLARTILPPSR